jgi:hypothetical protein
VGHVSGRGRFDHLLRWYPSAWRQRYGDELLGLLEDTYGDQSIPFRCRLSLVRAGTLERLRGSGLERDSNESRERVRSGSLLVLCAWAVFVVAGAGFAKFAEHWDAVTPKGARRLPADAYDAVQWAAQLGALVVLVAAAVSLPAFVRSIRQGGWAPIRRSVVRAIVVTSTAALATVGVVVWAHHLSPRQRNGALWPYTGVGALWALMIIATIATCAIAAVTVVRRLRFSARILKLLGASALVITLAMVVIIGGTLVWWGAVAADAPWFFGSGLFGSAASPTPPAMVIAGILMIVGLFAALLGAGRVVRSLPRVPAD